VEGDGGTSLSIGEVAERTGLNIHTVRFYEREGILPEPVRRKRNGHRVYGQEEVEWLAICKALRMSGMPLSAIRDYIVLVKNGPGNEHERLALLRQHQKGLLDQINELRHCSGWIERKISFYDDQIAGQTMGSVSRTKK
jgi:DNA-binding transcriptional MerR regulator